MSYLVRAIIIPAIITIAYFYGNMILEPPQQFPTNPGINQNEIRRVAMLLNNNGTPNEYGYLKTPVLLLTESSLSTYQKLRMKKWDIVDVATDEFYLSASISDMVVLGRIHINFYDYKKGISKTFEKNILPFMTPRMSQTSYRMFNSTQDDIIFEQGDFKFEIHNIDNKVTAKYHQRNITISSPADNLYVNLLWNITSNHEGIGVVAPLDTDKTYFLYNFKYPNIPVEGIVKIDGNEYPLNYSNAASGYNWARGVWPYNTHYWQARAQGHLETGKRFSLNLGGGYAHNGTREQATEDSFHVERFMYKLNYVEPKYNYSNPNSTWTFDCVGKALPFSECHIEFTPKQMQTSSFSLFVFKSQIRTVFGTFSGFVSNEQGKKTRFENINGFIEVDVAKW